jgi:hypothetical protein
MSRPANSTASARVMATTAPIFRSGRIVTPSASGLTSRREMPDRPWLGSVLAGVTITSTAAAPVMKAFWPLSSHASSDMWALVVSGDASEVDAGSVRAKASRA